MPRTESVPYTGASIPVSLHTITCSHHESTAIPIREAGPLGFGTASGGAGCPEPAPCKLQLPGKDPGMPIGLHLQDYCMFLVAKHATTLPTLVGRMLASQCFTSSEL